MSSDSAKLNMATNQLGSVKEAQSDVALCKIKKKNVNFNKVMAARNNFESYHGYERGEHHSINGDFVLTSHSCNVSQGDDIKAACEISNEPCSSKSPLFFTQQPSSFVDDHSSVNAMHLRGSHATDHCNSTSLEPLLR